MRRRGTTASSEAANYRQKAKRDFDGHCERCGHEIDWSDVEVHHVDRDRSNDNDDNLERMCHECHRVEHHGDDPLWRMIVSMPRPVLELLDKAVEKKGMHSRSEAVARAVVDQYDTDAGQHYGGPAESVSCWFSDNRHTRWVSDAVKEPPKDDNDE